MTINNLRREIEKIKKVIEPETHIGITIHYQGELRDAEGNILPESVIAIDGINASKLSLDKIQEIIANAEVIFCLPDNGRDPDMWQ